MNQKNMFLNTNSAKSRLDEINYAKDFLKGSQEESPHLYDRYQKQIDDLTNEERSLKSWLGANGGAYGNGGINDEEEDNNPGLSQKIIDDWYDDDWEKPQSSGPQRPDAVPSNPVNPQPFPLYIKGENTNPASGTTEDNEFPVYGGDEEDPELMQKLIEDFQRGDDDMHNPITMGTDGTGSDTGSIIPRSALSSPGDFNTNFDMLNSNNKNIGFNAVTDSANLTNKPDLNNMLITNGTATLIKALDTEIGTPKVQNLSNTTTEDDDSDTSPDPVAAEVPYTVENKSKYQAKLEYNKKLIWAIQDQINSAAMLGQNIRTPELDKELQNLYNQNECIESWMSDGEDSSFNQSLYKSDYIYKHESDSIAQITNINRDRFNWDLNNIKEIYSENKMIYEAISKATGIPPQLICALHYRESGCDFDTYLHNGQKLGNPTTIIPKGRIFNDFVEAAIDAMLSFKSLRDKYSITPDCKDMAALMGFAERYNGTGYIDNNHGLSPYIYSGTNLYTKGKYDKDSSYNAELVDAQPGVYILVKELMS